MANAFLDRVSNKALGEMLIEKGALSESQVNEALQLSREKGIRLGEALVSLGYLSRDALGYAIGEQYGLTPMELHPSMVDVELVSRFDFDLLSAHTMLPLIEIESDLVVVVSDPNDQHGLVALSRSLPEHVITPQLGTADQIRRCLEAVRPHLISGAAASKSFASQDPTGLAREILPITDPPEPGAPEFVEWLLGVAVSHPGRDVFVRDAGSALQVGLTPSASGASTEAAIQSLGLWPKAQTAEVRGLLLRRALPMEHTRGQAAQWPYPLTYSGDIYDILILMPILHNQVQFRVRALRRIDDQAEEQLMPISPSLQAGHYTVVLYDESVSLERALAQFIKENSTRHSFLVCQQSTRCGFPHAQAFPAPFVNMVGAAQASAATCVIFDHPVEYREAIRLLTSTYPPPAVLVCAPLPSHESGAGSLSPDIEELISRQGAQSVRLMESHTQTHPESDTRGNN